MNEELRARIEAAWAHSPLAEFTPDAQRMLARTGIAQIIEPGQSQAAGLTLVIDGLLRVFRAEGERQLSLRYLGGGDICGLPTALGSSETLQVEGLVRTSVLKLDSRVMRDQVLLETKNVLAAARAISQGHADIVAVLSDQVFLPVRKRVIRQLIARAERRDDGTLYVTESAAQIAKAIGSVAAVVSRVLSDLEAVSLIDRPVRLIVLRDLTGLHRSLRSDE